MPHRVVVGVAFDRQSGAGHERAMVSPGRLCEVDLPAGFGTSEELGAEAQCAAAARSLDRRASRFEPFRARAQHETPHAAQESRDTRGGKIGLGRLRCEEIPFRVRDRLHHRGTARVVAIHPHRQVDLARGGVAGEGFHQPQDRIRWHRIQTCECHCRSTLTGAFAAGRCLHPAFFVDSRVHGSSLATSARMDSAQQGNDERGHSARASAPEVPRATAGTGNLSVAGSSRE